MATYSTPPFELRSGDSDAASRWGGTQRPVSASYVADLQQALIDVGVLSALAPYGDFGPATENAVRRFAWYLKTVPVRILAGQAVPFTASVPPGHPGVASPSFCQVLADFVNVGASCAGNLVQVPFSAFARLHPSPVFGQLIAGASVVVVDREFAAMLGLMNAKAAQENLYVQVNQVFRVEGASVSGAVVPPATRSAHKLGRAIDLQLGTSSTSASLSTEMKNAPANAPFGRFRDYMVAVGCRYGGCFAATDPPHYDRQIFPVTGEEWTNRFFFAQRQYSGKPGSPATRIPRDPTCCA
ncbi:MAG TPA: peptidoglycan-binding domain-containing protein [Polyangiaceae bacterium]|jgi:hypothetical protein|nr:peptidoglycan-binding domain-containing protein [Polyangiaceae bacterium]